MDSINRLKNKWILITGATSGIGKASAVLFAESGTNLIITGRRNDRLQTLQKSLIKEHGVEVITRCFDVRDRDECKKAIQEIKHPIDILLNNAGLAVGTDPIYSGKFDDWDRMIDTNIKGLLTMTRFISAQMKERNEGHIINIGSIAGHEAYPGGVTYAATKHAVNAITKATKMDLHGSNVRVSAVSPGLVDTEFSEVRYYGDREKADKVYEDMKPLKAEDIAEIILFVANRPPHVNIMDTIVFPVQQSAATMVHQSSGSVDD
ncbi:MAG: SDR family NAD(P)-dependent oxidoreductase [Balneolaceae bacterium]